MEGPLKGGPSLLGIFEVIMRNAGFCSGISSMNLDNLVALWSYKLVKYQQCLTALDEIDNRANTSLIERRCELQASALRLRCELLLVHDELSGNG
jgi:hypothetical protein